VPYIRDDGPQRPTPSLDHEAAWINLLALLHTCTPEEQLCVLCELAAFAREIQDDELYRLRWYRRTVERAMQLEFVERDR